MQKIAKAVGFNDTAFVLPARNADFRIRYFAPCREVDLCGHATVAAFAALHRRSLLSRRKVGDAFMLETNAGVLPIGVTASGGEGPLVVMDQGTSQFAAFNGSRDVLGGALGIAKSDLHTTLPIVFGSTGRWTLVVPVRDLAAMRRMRLAPAQFAAALGDKPDASIHPFCS